MAEDLLGKVEPEIVVLPGQTAEEVKAILKDELKVDDLKVREYRELGRRGTGFYEEEKCKTWNAINTEGKAKLIFEDAQSCSNYELPDLRSRKNTTNKKNANWDKLKESILDNDLRVLAGLKEVKEERICLKKTTFKEGFDQFDKWRKAAGLKNASEEDLSGCLDPVKTLMDHILVDISAEFPDLRLNWTTGNWNPRLMVNEAPTKVCLERLASAYKGLLNITDEVNATNVISNIVSKKIKELFI